MWLFLPAAGASSSQRVRGLREIICGASGRPSLVTDLSSGFLFLHRFQHQSLSSGRLQSGPHRSVSARLHVLLSGQGLGGWGGECFHRDLNVYSEVAQKWRSTRWLGKDIVFLSCETLVVYLGTFTGCC